MLNTIYSAAAFCQDARARSIMLQVKELTQNF